MSLLERHDSIIAGALGAFEALRKLNFPAEDIFVVNWPHEDGFKVGVSLGNDEKGPSFALGVVPYDREELMNRWSDASKDWNELATEEERQELWERFMSAGLHLRIVEALAFAGIQIPYGGVQ